MLLAFLYILHLNGFLNTNIPSPEANRGSNIPRNGEPSESQIGATKEDVIDVNEFLGNMPKHLSLLSHQAGGIPFSQDKKTLGLLKDSRGYVLKPTNKKTINEVNFYKEVQKGYHPKLAPLIPAFYGTVSVPLRDKSVEFMVLEDLAHGFEKPCVLNMKIGKRTWDSNATNEKIIYEKGKYTACKELYGFCIPGFVIVDPITNKKTSFDRQYCRSLDPESLVKEMERFVHTTGDSQATAALLKRIILELERVLEWVSTQTELRLYASSIIILYDSQALLSLVPYIHKENQPGNPLDFVRVKVVDFAHTHKAPEHEGVDTNYLYGVNSVLNIFQNILMKHSNSM